ncbi:hypothetical protein D3C79_746740 [compost metagenome]
MQPGHRQGRNKCLHFVRGNHEQAIGLAPVTGDLGQELVRRDTGRHGDMQLLGNPPANICSNPRGAAGEPGTVRHIQVSLIQRQWLDQIGVLAKDPVNFPRGFFIGINARFDDQQVRAQLEGMTRGHRRAHPERPRLIVAGSDHPTPLRRAAHRQWPSDQARIVAHFDGGVEAIAVDMDDLALRHR